MLVTPLRPVEILVGKALPGFLIGLAEASVIILVATFWFRVPPLMQDITLLNPLRYFMGVLRGVFLEGTPIDLLVHQF